MTDYEKLADRLWRCLRNIGGAESTVQLVDGTCIPDVRTLLVDAASAIRELMADRPAYGALLLENDRLRIRIHELRRGLLMIDGVAACVSTGCERCAWAIDETREMVNAAMDELGDVFDGGRTT